jgi:CheY-like chemotaxis protein
MIQCRFVGIARDGIDSQEKILARILVIEDEDLVRFTLRDSLESAGHEVVEAKNGQEGLDALGQEPFDLVITDIIMPVKEGVETTIEIRRSFPTVKVIAISGGGRMRDMRYLQMAKDYGAACILQKPFQNEDLFKAIRGCLGN